jgi:ketosteroid isomerase-like protein
VAGAVSRVSVTTSTTRSTAEAVYATIASDDSAPFLALCADDVTIIYPAAGRLPYGGEWHGRAGAAAFLDAHDAAEEILSFDVMTLIADGDTAVAEGRFAGRAKPSGRTWSTAFAHVLTIADGRLQRLNAHFDSDAAVRARSGTG